MRVLRVEDDADTAQTVTKLLKAEGHDCDTADSGKRALELAGNAEYDLILLDIGMPDIEGYEVLNRLRGASVATPVIIQSGLILRKNEVKDLGVKGCLAKPFGRHELAENIRTIVPEAG